MRGQPDPAWNLPLYSIADAARIIRQRPSTVGNWARGYPYPTKYGGVRQQAPIVTRVPGIGGKVLPFPGLAEAFVLTQLKNAGVPMMRIRPAVEELKREMGSIEFALLSDRLKTDGARVIFEYLIHDDPHFAPVDALATVTGVPDRQLMFREAVEDALRPISYELGTAQRITLPQFGVPVMVDPHVNAGRPTLASSGVRVDVLLNRSAAGEGVEDLADDFGITAEEVAVVLSDARPAA